MAEEERWFNSDSDVDEAPSVFFFFFGGGGVGLEFRVYVFSLGFQGLGLVMPLDFRHS